MVDPAVAFQPGKNYTAYDQGAEMDVFMKNPGNTNYTWFVGVVWPGLTVWPVSPTRDLQSLSVHILNRIGSIQTPLRTGTRNSCDSSIRKLELMLTVYVCSFVSYLLTLLTADV